MKSKSGLSKSNDNLLHTLTNLSLLATVAIKQESGDMAACTNPFARSLLQICLGSSSSGISHKSKVVEPVYSSFGPLQHRHDIDLPSNVQATSQTTGLSYLMAGCRINTLDPHDTAILPLLGSISTATPSSDPK